MREIVLEFLTPTGEPRIAALRSDRTYTWRHTYDGSDSGRWRYNRRRRTTFLQEPEDAYLVALFDAAFAALKEEARDKC